jgi:hypothetical protein
MFNKKIYLQLLLFLCVVIFFIYIFSPVASFREGMTNTWSADTIKNFPPAWAKIAYAAEQVATPPGTQSITQLQQSTTQVMNSSFIPFATDAEAQQYISTGTWSWTPDQIKAATLYLNQQNATAKPPQTSDNINATVAGFQTMYPFGTIQYILGTARTINVFSMTARGYGGCVADSAGNYSFMKQDASGNPTIPVPNDQLTSLIPGFTFINGSCNPCELTNNPPNYSCPYSLSDSSGNNVPPDPLMEYSWKLGPFAPASVSGSVMGSALGSVPGSGPGSVPGSVPGSGPGSVTGSTTSDTSVTDKLKNALSALT